MFRAYAKLPILLALLTTTPLGASAAEPLQVRVLSYNIHHAEGVDGRLDLARIAKVIESVEPDVIALQEVDQNARRTGAVDQPAELARLTGMQVVFGANIELQGGHYGNAVLTRWPIVHSENHLLPNVDDGEQRGVLLVDVAPPQQAAVRLLATHLDHRRDERERLASAKMINRLIEKHGEQPAVLAGDLNATPESQTLSELRKAWTPVNEAPLPTIPVARPARQIDFVLYRPAGRWRVIEVRVLEEAVASDHRAIFAVIELRTAE